MSTSVPGRDTEYELCIARLIEYVKRARLAPWSPTPAKRAMTALSRKLEELANLLESDPYALSVEDFHNARAEPDFQTIKHGIHMLAESARLAADDLPNPREKPAIGIAAQGFLHIRHAYGLPQPALSNNSPGVLEFGQVCESAGIPLSPERLRGALAEAFNSFDKYDAPEGISDLFRR